MIKTNADYTSFLKEEKLIGDEKAEKVEETIRKIADDLREHVSSAPYLWHDSITQVAFATRYVEQMFGEGARVRVVDEQTIEVEMLGPLETIDINMRLTL